MLRKDLYLQCRRRSPSFVQSELYISGLRAGKGIGTGFPKHSIFHLSIMLRKQSHGFITKLVCHITSTSVQSFLCKKRKKIIFPDSLSTEWDKDRREEWEKLEMGTLLPQGVWWFWSAMPPAPAFVVVTLKIIGQWRWRRKLREKILLKCMRDCQPLWRLLLVSAWFVGV